MYFKYYGPINEKNEIFEGGGDSILLNWSSKLVVHAVLALFSYKAFPYSLETVIFSQGILQNMLLAPLFWYIIY